MTTKDFDALKPGDSIRNVGIEYGSQTWEVSRKTTYGWQIKRIDSNFRIKFGKAVNPNHWVKVAY